MPREIVDTPYTDLVVAYQKWREATGKKVAIIELPKSNIVISEENR